MFLNLGKRSFREKDHLCYVGLKPIIGGMFFVIFVTFGMVARRRQAFLHFPENNLDLPENLEADGRFFPFHSSTRSLYYYPCRWFFG